MSPDHAAPQRFFSPTSHPKIYLSIISLLIILSITFLVLFVHVEVDPKNILKVNHSVMQPRMTMMDLLFPSTKSLRAIPVVLTSRRSNGMPSNDDLDGDVDNVDDYNILQKEVLVEVFDLRRRMAEMEVIVHSSRTGTNNRSEVVQLKDICLQMSGTSWSGHEKRSLLEPTGSDWGAECYIPSVLDYWSSVSKLLEDSDHLKTLSYKLKTVTGGSIDPSDSLIGDITWNSARTRIERATVLSFTLLFSDGGSRGDDGSSADPVLAWESKLLQFASQANSNGTYSFRILVQSDSMLNSEIERAFYKIGPLFIVGLALSGLVVFASFIYMRSAPGDSIVIRLIVGSFGIFLVIGSISGSIALCQLLFGCPMTPLSAQALPLFLFGIGVDGLFIYQSYWNNHKVWYRGMRESQAMTNTSGDIAPSTIGSDGEMSQNFTKPVAIASGVSSLLISSTLILILLSMGKSSTLMTRSLTYQTIVSIVLNYTFLLFGFSNCLQLESRYNDRKIVVARTSLDLDQTCDRLDNTMDMEDHKLSWYDRYCEFQSQLSNKTWYSILVICLVAVAVVSSVTIIVAIPQVPFQIVDFYAEDSQLMEVFELQNTMFNGTKFPGFIILASTNSSKVDFTSRSVHELLDSLSETVTHYREQEEIVESVLPFVHSNTVTNWFSYFRSWTFFVSNHTEEYRRNGFQIPREQFHGWFDEFRTFPPASSLSQLVIQDGTTREITYSRMLFSNRRILNSDDAVRAKRMNLQLEESIARKYHPNITRDNFYVLNTFEPFFESFFTFNSDLIRLLVLSFLCVSLVSVAVVLYRIYREKNENENENTKSDSWQGIVALASINPFMIIVSSLELLAVIRLLHIPVNPLSVMNLMLLIGLFSEFYTHYLQSFIYCGRSVQRSTRMILMPLAVSGLSTTLSILPLAFHEIVLVRSYFFQMIICGQLVLIANTFVLLPVLLGIVEKRWRE